MLLFALGICAVFAGLSTEMRCFGGQVAVFAGLSTDLAFLVDGTAKIRIFCNFDA
jgi:hypothetical protein